MKQGRAFGVECVVATQNPMDLDYRALGNAGLWWIGRLQTDADRARVIDGLETVQAGGGGRGFSQELARTLGRLAPRWFVMRDVYLDAGALLLQPRWTMSFMRGPMTGREIRLAREMTGAAADTPLGLNKRTSRTDVWSRNALRRRLVEQVSHTVARLERIGSMNTLFCPQRR